MVSKQFFFCFWSIVGVLGLNVATEAKESRDIAKQVFPSVVMLVMEDKSGQPLSLGSGFFVQEKIIATNLHVVEGSAGGYAKIVGEKQKYAIAGYVAIDNKMDLVLLKISDVKVPHITLGDSENTLDLRPIYGTPITLGDSSKIAVGDEIFAVGNPKGLEGTFSKGIVSAIRKIEEDTLLQITAPISPGSSGGPILNSEGDVIGISVATFKGGQNLNFAIPVSYLSNLLANIKSVKPLSVEEKPKKEVKSILADLGEQNTKGVTCSNFLWDSAFNPYGVGSFAFPGTNGRYTVSFQNKLQEPIKNVQFLIIFYDVNDEPVDVDIGIYKGIIPSYLAKRVKSSVDSSVQKLTTDDNSIKPKTRIEFRVLDFQIVEDSGDKF